MAVPEIGKIKIGDTVKAKDRNGKDYDRPVSLDYFRATGKYESYFREAYGDKPDTIQVVFISDSFEDVCSERYEIRQGKDLYAFGDGEAFEVWSDDAYRRFTLQDAPNLMDRVAAKCGGVWSQTITLRFILPAIRGVIGQWRFTSKGAASTIPAVRDAFDFVMQRAGTVINIPFDLTVEKVKSQKPGSKSLFPVVKLIPNVSTGHLEMVSSFLEAGNDVRKVRGMLTESVIEELAPKQLYETTVSKDDTFEPNTELFEDPV